MPAFQGSPSSDRLFRSAVTLLAVVALAPPHVEGQAVQLRVGFGVSALSTATWTPLYGPSVGVEISSRNGWGIGLGYQSADRYRGEVPGYCGFASCVDGPLDEEVFIRSFGVDVGRPVLRGQHLDLRGALRARFFTQGRHMTDRETGDEFDRGKATDWGLGARVDARARARLVGFAPFMWLSYDRVFATDCAADASCYGSRNHMEAGIGLLLGR